MAAFFAIFFVLSCSGDADKNGGKKNAIELMKRHPMCSIEAIANECGMERVNFHRRFVEEFGITPSEFKKQHID